MTIRVKALLRTAAAVGLVAWLGCFLDAASLLLTLLGVGGLVLLFVLPLHRSLHHLRAQAESAERELRQKNALLEDALRARGAELEKAHTRLGESQEQLKAAQTKLLYTDRMAIVGQLAAGVGHEINTPLASVISHLGYVHKALGQVREIQSEEEWEDLRTVVAEARQSAERVKTIVKDLKSLAQADESSRGPVDLAAVVHTAVNMVSHQLRERARVVEDCATVPPVHGNPARLGQVFLNLILNAVQAIPKGNPEANEIRLVARVETPGQVVVEVSDTGQGIPEEYLGRIFDPFFTTKAVGEGAGLGLSVCHSIITGLQGSIRVESQVGRGTTFHITLPVAEGLYPVSHH